MKTDDLIANLSTEAARAASPPGRVTAIAVAVGIVATVAALLAILGGPREDFVASLASSRFLMKFAVTLSLVASALPLFVALGRPGAGLRTLGLALLLPILVVGSAVTFELETIRSADILPNLVGTNALHCLVLVPILGAGPLVALVIALRHAAPTRPRLAGIVAGLVAGGIGATAYASYCPDDSPLFVATWYTIGIAVLGLAGSWIASRFARW